MFFTLNAKFANKRLFGSFTHLFASNSYYLTKKQQLVDVKVVLKGIEGGG